MKDLVFIASGLSAAPILWRMLGAGVIDCWSEHEPDVLADTLGRSGYRGLNDLGWWHMLLAVLPASRGLQPLGHRLPYR
jgi:hypothetical protein